MKSPLSWFRDLFARRGQDPVQQIRYVLPYPVAGLNLTPDEILSLSATWACIDIIAKSIASCWWNVLLPKKSGNSEILIDDPMMYLLNTRPNPEMTAIGFREAMLFTAVPFGNAYAEIVRDGAGRVAALWPLPQDRISPVRSETWELLYEYLQPDGSRVLLTQREVLHIRGPGLYGLMGENLVARAAKSMAVAAAQERHAASYFGQGANPGGVLTAPGIVNDGQHKRLKEDWAEKKKGPENAHKPMILEAGWTYAQTTTDPQKSQLVESRQFSVEEIARWFGVPPHKIQHLLRATFSNIEHQSIEFVRDALTPWCRRLEQEVDYKGFRQDRAPWRYTKIDTAPLLAGDAKSRAEAYASLRQNGVINANEIRHKEGLNSMGPDGDVYLVQSNLTTVENIVNPPKPPAPALPPGKQAGVEDDQEDDGDQQDSGAADAASVARQALTVILAGALERYARRLSNRRNDLAKRRDGPDLQALLDDERARLWPRLLSELAPAGPFAALALGRVLEEGEIRRAADLVVVDGVPPAEATAKALPASCPRSG